MDVLLCNHSLEFTIEPNKKETAVYLLNTAPQGHIKCKQFYSAKARWPGDWNRWIQPFRPCLVPRSLQGKGGEGVWPGMGIHGYSSLYHPSHQLKKTRDNGRIVQYILLFLTSLKNCTWMTEWYEYRIMLDLDYCRVPAQPNLAACPMLTPQQT